MESGDHGLKCDILVTTLRHDEQAWEFEVEQAQAQSPIHEMRIVNHSGFGVRRVGKCASAKSNPRMRSATHSELGVRRVEKCARAKQLREGELRAIQGLEFGESRSAQA